MAKLHKIEMYVLDVNEDYLNNPIEEVVYYNSDLTLKIVESEMVDIEWHDDIDLNKIDCPIENYERYFNNTDITYNNCKFCIYSSVNEVGWYCSKRCLYLEDIWEDKSKNEKCNKRKEL